MPYDPPTSLSNARRFLLGQHASKSPSQHYSGFGVPESQGPRPFPMLLTLIQAIQPHLSPSCTILPMHPFPCRDNRKVNQSFKSIWYQLTLRTETWHSMAGTTTQRIPCLNQCKHTKDAISRQTHANKTTSERFCSDLEPPKNKKEDLVWR